MKVQTQIPLPAHVFKLSSIFKANGFVLYVVGGAVRDFLMHQQSGSAGVYSPKDVDLATDAPPRDVATILTHAKVRNFEKGESFGVWVAHIDGEDYEIATFREDGQYTDGRRPDSVQWATPESDYKRRDLTMNALFYEIPVSAEEQGEIIDYGGGIGLEDIKAKRVRVVGDPYDRFGEDKLRIPRIVRFHSRYNEGDVREVLDGRTHAAIMKFRDLRAHGVSGPRIQQEFVAGLKKAMSVPSYLKNYENLGLMGEVFPGIPYELDLVDRLHETNNPIIVLALLFRKNMPDSRIIHTRNALNRLDWPNEIVDEVMFLLRFRQAVRNPSTEEFVRLAFEMVKKPARHDLAHAFGILMYDEVDRTRWLHLSQIYVPESITGEEIESRYGIKPGPEMGRKQRELYAAHYEGDWKNWKNQANELLE